MFVLFFACCSCSHRAGGEGQSETREVFRTSSSPVSIVCLRPRSLGCVVVAAGEKDE